MELRKLLPLWLGSALLISGCKSFNQTPDQAMYRAPGDRLLRESGDVSIPARQHWQYAWLAVASYNAIADEPGEKEPLGSTTRAGPVTIMMQNREVTCSPPERELEKAGWARFMPAWPAPGSDLYETLRRTHTRVQVWENRTLGEVVVSFGGTDGRNILDWLSNIRWFVPDREDEYVIVSRHLAPQFVEEFKRRAKLPENAYMREVKIRATGHSLGGGLAQQFAYALPADPDVPRVTEVYAFNSSPVTGHDDVPEDTRKGNVRGMKIDRIYERGEFLAAARASASVVRVPSIENPTIRTVRYMLFYTTPFEFVSQHSMPKLACHLQYSKDSPSLADTRSGALR